MKHNFSIIVLFSLLCGGCATNNPMDGTNIKDVSAIPSMECKEVGKVDGRTYLGSGFVAVTTDHYLARRDAIKSADPALLAQATHIVWGRAGGFGVDAVSGTLYSCP